MNINFVIWVELSIITSVCVCKNNLQMSTAQNNESGAEITEKANLCKVEVEDNSTTGGKPPEDGEYKVQKCPICLKTLVFVLTFRFKPNTA